LGYNAARSPKQQKLPAKGKVMTQQTINYTYRIGQIADVHGNSPASPARISLSKSTVVEGGTLTT
jgi:hypothetical protein